MKNKLISQSSSGLSIRKLLILSCLTGTIVTTLPLKTIAQPSTTPISQCPAKDWSALQSEINRRYTALETSLDQMIQEVNNPNIPQETIKSVNQIQAIDSLLSCLNNPLVDSQSKQPIIDSLTQLKNNVLLPPQTGLTSNNLIKLKRNIGLQDNEPTIGNNFIKRFSETIETFRENASSEISQLEETLFPFVQTPEISSSLDQSISKKTTITADQEIIGAILLMLGGSTLLIFLTLVRSHLLFNMKKAIYQDTKNVKLIKKQKDAIPSLTQDNSYEIAALKQEITNLQSQLLARNQPQINHTQSLDDKPTETQILSVDTVELSPSKINQSAPFSIKSSEDLITFYNINSSQLESSMTRVSETESSFSTRRSGSQNFMIFEINNNKPRFWIYDDRFLVPSPKSKITTPLLNAISGAFEHSGFSSGYPFELVQPAIVEKILGTDDRWQLVTKGEIKFISTPEPATDTSDN